MERSVYDITLDIQRSYAPWELTVKKGDTHRRLQIRLLSGGSPYPVTDDCYGVFTAQKPDGTVLYNRCSREGDRFVYDLTPQTTATVGIFSCELRLYGAQDALLTAAGFTLNVEDTVYTEGDQVVTSMGEATALTQLITQAREGITEMEKVLANEPNHAVIDDTKVGSDAWSAKNIADKLCPAFTESGAVVQCEPVEGYPLEVISTIAPKDSGETWGEINLYHSGKNLLKAVTGAVENFAKSGRIDIKGNTVILNTIGNTVQNVEYFNWARDSFTLPAGTYTISATYVSGTVERTNREYYIGLRNANNDWIVYIPMYGGASKSRKLTLTKTTAVAIKIMANASNGYDNLTFNVQVESGDTATAFEPYKGTTVYTADFTNYPVPFGSYNWTTGVLTDDAGNLYQHDLETDTFEMIDEESTAAVRNIHAFPGVNTLASDCGDTQVSGRVDPVAIIEKLTNAIVALGGNI